MKLLKVQFKPNEIALMSAVVVTMMVLFSFYWKTSGMAVGLNALKAKSEVSKRSLAENQALIDKLTKRVPASDGVSAEYLDQYVLLNDRISSVIAGIVNSTKGRSFTLSKLLQEEQSIEGGYKKILYSLDAEASFIDIGKFLEKLEDAALLTEVKAVEINRIDDEMKRCKAHIRLYSYVRVDEKI